MPNFDLKEVEKLVLSMNSSAEPKNSSKSKAKAKKSKSKKSALKLLDGAQPPQFFKKLSTTESLQTNYKPDWIDKVDFEMCDAATPIDKYCDA